ncbi:MULTISPECIES: DUF3019 domain-containing protein [Rheinheimera]|jgi:hypothetical protein|uniref:DUF3019 domain-containing protein n=1 Tax=Rheinheimera aquimaris TaxID=412437 RepID=A0ABN1DMY3_9GAMM|nr:DUF3019 domain-containing protein [Rheinheimera aquimaris]MCB5213232.1 DUF3019 domain-containing protein [Rheinheimera aquimaris]MCD1597097.1 DUF3019 domain-containing protein [Rheinheimera aquimaris]HBN88827.1 hypothetical protein [Rheinheimera sp.]|tara:strand:+ start:270 stop:650 length:381 start_codon:yes stop_codon:yes gene_type:complete
MQGLWLLLALNGIAAPNPLPANCSSSLCWDVSPQICVTEQQNQSCQTRLQLHWYSQTALSTCLYMAEEKLQCWQQAEQGHWQHIVSWQNTELSLRDSDNRILLRTELQVLSRKPAQRRLSSPWSIF